MRLHKEGKRILLFTLIAFVIIGILVNKYTPAPWSYIILLFITCFYLFIVWFFRNPNRVSESASLDVIAPVDGKVVVLEKVYEKEYLKREVIQLSIFMSPLNVHVCRYPVSGIVKFVKYHAGKYLVAFHPKSSELNERTTTVVETANGQEVLFRQIAGAVARRIVIYPKVGDEAKAGQEYGFIKFGSRLDVFLPLDAEILCKLGDKPKGAITKIAELKA
ncbi:phosphatidylserine decarboxylase family protein [Ornithobacterium rhinotracheale]|uniref:Phosphatidylserine decarboxylase proenzyme n=2 Tax=Ornithobacterium rhinotracheale TaxID=28251 RepID=I4A3D2_ORNRL|nr:phosphatidylserine decarboxylase family protein [Ornithobacterium rhinotracheale]AFL98466.1 phosphatidylserine decarboxylase precursor-related protein [Ornithobacterium rhinotracheale DSM 15997]AIQ00193.1 phosphatidylserine decarboxylase [Ornithobacterium rhinotracheale ORT-UMN 88]KGB65773.1 phosphatidylserine decarboxylase [Ornithobacterium rhinotracheale H06-030791]MBN3662891.1 phosphatidylserine decarboxylase family protein [Ornithobacterium rhinotracheale]MCK0193185.1 phosphatidylserine